MQAQPIYPGTAIVITATFTRLGAPFAPTAPIAKVRRPNGTIITPVVTALAANRFEATFLVDVPGMWTYRWESSGNGQVGREMSFKVEPTAFAA